MAQQGQGITLHDNAIGWIILGGVFFAVFLLFWYFNEYAVKSLFRWLRWSEMWFVSLFVTDDYTVYWHGDKLTPKPNTYSQWVDAVPKIPSGRLDNETISAISTLAMEPLKLPFALVIVLMSVWVLLRGPGTEFRRKMGLDELIAAQSKNFPAIAPFVEFNPSNQPPRAPGSPVPAELPAFAEALGPEEWLAYNQIPLPDGKVDQDATYRAFSKQLGARWQGSQKLAPYKQIILASFCLKASRKRKEADEMLGRLANCWSFEKGLNLGRDKKLLNEARSILRKKEMAETVLSKCNLHGFETTALLRGLMTAREEGGVLAPSAFLWLRSHDRTLWYPLNNLGRQAFHTEALGAMSHFKAERLTRRPIPKPKVDGAVKSIVDYMASRRARPVPALDYKGAKNTRGVKQPANVNKGKPAPQKKKK